MTNAAERDSGSLDRWLRSLASGRRVLYLHELLLLF